MLKILSQRGPPTVDMNRSRLSFLVLRYREEIQIASVNSCLEMGYDIEHRLPVRRHVIVLGPPIRQLVMSCRRVLLRADVSDTK